MLVQALRLAVLLALVAVVAAPPSGGGRPGRGYRNLRRHKCPRPWRIFRGTKMCVQKFKDEKTWFQAKDRCKNLGGTLAIISSTDQNDFIHERIIKKEDINVYWIGLQRTKDGYFIWADGEYAESVRELPWLPVKNNRTDYDCVGINGLRMFESENEMIRTETWDLHKCNWNHGYICERLQESISDTTEDPEDEPKDPDPVHGGFTHWSRWSDCSAYCGKGYMSRTRSCTNPSPRHGGDDCSSGEATIMYRRCNTGVACSGRCTRGWVEYPRREMCIKKIEWFATWITAESTCLSLGARLLQLHNEEDDNFIFNHFIRHSVQSYWISLNDIHEEGRLDWTDQIYEEHPEKLPWYDENYENDDLNNCVMINIFRKNTWMIMPCDLKVHYFCEKPQEDHPDPPRYPVDGGFSPWSSWSRCSENCGRGVRSRTMLCTNPSPQYGGRDCLSLEPTIDFKSCDTGFRCSTNCQVGWMDTPELERCIKVIQHDLNWTDSRQLCHLHGGELLKLWNDAEINYTFENVLKGSEEWFWIGLNDREKEGRLQWVDGTEVEDDTVLNTVFENCGVMNSLGSRVHSLPEDWTLLKKHTSLKLCDMQFYSICQKPWEPENLTILTLKDGREHYDLSAWSQWTHCSATCRGPGTQTRTRRCMLPGHQQCPEEFATNQTRTCSSRVLCPSDGNWGAWTAFGECSITCGSKGYRIRTRSCDNPPPRDNGQNCKGNDEQITRCDVKERPCVIDGDWGEWTSYGECSVTCGDRGLRTRTRKCDNPTPQVFGKECEGRDSETKACDMRGILCPIDGSWGAWTRYGECSVTCGPGGRMRKTRTCNNPAPQNNGRQCTGISSRSRSCRPPPKSHCPIDGGLSPWSSWSSCSVTCGHHGTKTRTRSCTNPTPQHGGAKCSSEDGLEETKSCYTGVACGVDGKWGAWTSYSDCSVTCGSDGRKRRTRKCNNPAPQNNGKKCEGNESEFEPCSKTPCPIDGGLSLWSSWSSCSVTCGHHGTKTRTRSCTNPTPQHGGAKCSSKDDLEETESCNANVPCAIDGSWGAWTSYGECSVVCGSRGRKRRTRRCNNPAPQNNGKECKGRHVEYMVCDRSRIPCLIKVDGNWGAWTSYSECSVTCGYGGWQRRTRRCNNPAPRNNGKDCVGLHYGSRRCDKRGTPCPIDGDWGAWTSYAECSVTCGGIGNRMRTRKCDKPAPQNNGKYCTGHGSEFKHCDMTGIPCPIDGGLTAWSDWSSCSVTCGTGIRTKTRSCTNPTPQYGGAKCSSEDPVEDYMSCDADAPCAIDGNWGAWTSYGECSVTCGDGGQRTRTRKCNNPAPRYNGKECQGDKSHYIHCYNSPCPIDGGLTAWSDWSSCSVTCGVGERIRTRSCTIPTPQRGFAKCPSGDGLEETESCQTDVLCADPSASQCREQQDVLLKVNDALKSIEERMDRLENKLPQMLVEIAHLISGLKQNKDVEYPPYSCFRGMDRWFNNKYIIVNEPITNRYIQCDTHTDSGGWLVIQRRMTFGVDFNRTWNEYRNGFGVATGDYWLGLEHIHQITSKHRYELYIVEVEEGERVDDHQYFFRVEGESDNYRLISNGLDQRVQRRLGPSNNSEFSTFDRAEDESRRNCARRFHGGWWYPQNCGNYKYHLNTMSVDMSSGHRLYVRSRDAWYLEMKIRRVDPS